MVLKTAIVVVLILLLGYGIKEAWPLVQGPELLITSPQNGEVFHTTAIAISGQAIHTQAVSLDGGPLVTDQEGHFSTTLTLPPGDAILTITATDRFGRTVTEEREVAVP